MKPLIPPAGNRHTWHVGLRVCRKRSFELGTVVEVKGSHIKVKWDGGRTSYFSHGQAADIQLDVTDARGRIKNREMHLRHFNLAERHVAEGVRRIAEQEARLSELAAKKHDTKLARRLLQNFHAIQAHHVAHRDAILKELAEIAPAESSCVGETDIPGGSKNHA